MIVERFDHCIDNRREVRTPLPVGEEINIPAGPGAHAVFPYGVAAGEREAVLSGCGQGNLGYPAMDSLHGR